GQLTLIHKPLDRSSSILRVQDQEGQRQGRARHIRASHVQKPGDGVRLSEDRCASAQLRQARCDLLTLFFRWPTGEVKWMRVNLTERRFRPVVPYRVQRVGRASDKTTAEPRAVSCQAAHLVLSMKPGIIAQLATAQMFSQPGRERRFAYMPVLIEPGIRLLFGLQRVASVDEEGSPLLENRCKPGGAAEAGQPKQALGGGRYILPLMLICTRHQEAIDTSVFQFG